MRSLRYLNSVLTIIAVLLTLHLYTLWTSDRTPDLATTAQAAGIPDAGAQRKEMVDQLKLLNQNSEQLAAMFKSGSARVKVDMPPQDHE